MEMPKAAAESDQGRLIATLIKADVAFASDAPCPCTGGA